MKHNNIDNLLETLNSNTDTGYKKPLTEDVIETNITSNFDTLNSVKVLKNIQSGLTISIKGDLSVEGDIGDSNIVVYGDLFCAGVIKGRGKNRIVVHGGAKLNSLDTTVLECNKSIFVTNSIIDSKVKSKMTISVDGNIIGGNVLSTHGIKANYIGSPDKIKTHIGTGIDFKLKVLLDEMQSELDGVCKKKEQIENSIFSLEEKGKNAYAGLSYTEKKVLGKAKESFKIFEKQVEGLLARKKKLEKKLEKTSKSYIEVLGKIYPNTYFSIQNRFTITKHELPTGKYSIKNEKIYRL